MTSNKLLMPKIVLFLMIISLCLVIVQFQIVSSWFEPVTAPLFEVESLDPYIETLANRLHLNRFFVATVADGILKELKFQINQHITALSNATKIKEVWNKLDNITILPPLYIITPTYRRPEQIAELTRLAQTLMHVPRIYWILVEDAKLPSPQVAELLQRSGLQFVHLVASMPEIYKQKKGSKPRGVSNRMRGLEWLRANASDGVFYFADDDNTYDIALFNEMRFTKKVSMWPVGLCTNYGVSTPITINGTFVGFYDGWRGNRKFPVDMAGFAVSVKFLHQRPKANMPYKAGCEEDGFLKSLAPFEPNEIELKADNCTKILVWHTQAKDFPVAKKLDHEKHKNTNLIILRSLIV